MKRLGALAFILFCISIDSLSAPPPFKMVPEIMSTGEDPLSEYQWYLQKARVEEAWLVTQGKPQTLVAVVDSGIQYNHPELNPNLRLKKTEWPFDGNDDDGNGFVDDAIGWDFVKNSPLPMDGSGHGTFMASLISSRMGNGIGIRGICPFCRLLPVRFLDAEGLGDNSDGARAIRYAAHEGAKVINISTAGEGYDSDWEDAIAFAGAMDAVVVVSSGNSPQNLDAEPLYPANFKFPFLLTVSASTPNDNLMSGASWGKESVSLLAPGEDIYGIDEDSYGPGSGTSQAAAVVSGVVGLVRSVNPNLSAKQTVSLIRSTVRKVPGLEKKCQTGGVIDAYRAVKSALSERHLPFASSRVAKYQN